MRVVRVEGILGAEIQLGEILHAVTKREIGGDFLGVC